MNILVTGCNGFVGSALVNYLSKISGLNVTGLCRDDCHTSLSDSRIVCIDDLANLEKVSDILSSMDVVIHAAGKAHVMDKKGCMDEQDYFLINTDLSVDLAKEASNCGVKRFIYLSSTKVFGDPEPPAICFTYDSPTIPTDAYGESKLQAEHKLMEVAKKTGLEVVVIRPPVVYGQGVKGNMKMLSKLVNSGVPLPFGSISFNKRSMVSIDNLNDLICHCLKNPAANGQTLLVSDDHDLSTFEIISLLKKYIGSKTLVFPVSKNILYLLGYVINSSNKIRKLVESSVVDISHTKMILNWVPPQSVEEAFEKMTK